MKVVLGYFWITLDTLRSTLDHFKLSLGSLWATVEVYMRILGDFRSPKVARATNSQAGGSAGRVRGGCEEGARRARVWCGWKHAIGNGPWGKGIREKGQREETINTDLRRSWPKARRISTKKKGGLVRKFVYPPNHEKVFLCDEF